MLLSLTLLVICLVFAKLPLLALVWRSMLTAVQLLVVWQACASCLGCGSCAAVKSGSGGGRQIRNCSRLLLGDGAIFLPSASTRLLDGPAPEGNYRNCGSQHNASIATTRSNQRSLITAAPASKPKAFVGREAHRFSRQGASVVRRFSAIICVRVHLS